MYFLDIIQLKGMREREREERKEEGNCRKQRFVAKIWEQSLKLEDCQRHNLHNPFITTHPTNIVQINKPLESNQSPKGHNHAPILPTSATNIFLPILSQLAQSISTRISEPRLIPAKYSYQGASAHKIECLGVLKTFYKQKNLAKPPNKTCLATQLKITF